MSEQQHASPPIGDRSIMDTLMYILAGSAMTIMSLSFLLWLRF